MRRIGIVLALVALFALGAPSLASAGGSGHGGDGVTVCESSHGHGGFWRWEWFHHHWRRHRVVTCCGPSSVGVSTHNTSKHQDVGACGPPPVVPEAPLVALLPLAAASVGAGYLLYRRRGTRRSVPVRVG